jgi:hypothetical protein
MKSPRSLLAGVVLCIAFPALSLAQAAEAKDPNPFMTLFVTLAPLVFFLWLAYRYMKRVGIDLNKQHVERSLVHMERVEQQNHEMLETLRRIETRLHDRDGSPPA